MSITEVFAPLSAALCVLYLTVKYLEWRKKARIINQIPGRKGYPVIGNVLDFMKSKAEMNKAINAYMSEFPSIFKVWFLGVPIICIKEPEDMERILGNVSHNTKGYFYHTLLPWLGTGLLTSSGKKWHVRRKMLTAAFHFNILQKYFQVFNKESKILVNKLKHSNGKEVDIIPLINDFTLGAICETAMGTSIHDSKEGTEYRRAVHDYGNIAVDRMVRVWLMVDMLYKTTAMYWKQKRTLQILHDFSTKVIQIRKKYFDTIQEQNIDSWITSSGKKQLAMLDLLVLAQKNGENIEDEGIREEVDTFIFEGHDTTAASINFTLMLLANNRKCQDKIYEEIKLILGDTDRDAEYTELNELKYMERCIKESLRLYPSVHAISRVMGEDTVSKSGKIIPKGVTVFLGIHFMHKREDLYPDAEKFDPDRFLPDNIAKRHTYAYIPFSAGPRNCIGQKFAMMEMKCVLTEVLKNYILEPVTRPEDIVFVTNLILRTRDPIKVKFVPRNQKI